MVKKNRKIKKNGRSGKVVVLPASSRYHYYCFPAVSRTFVVKRVKANATIPKNNG